MGSSVPHPPSSVIGIPTDSSIPGTQRRRSPWFLAPYAFRVAIGDHRIASCDDGRVTFAYRRVESMAADDAGGDGVPPTVLAARAAVGFAEGASLRIPEPGERGGAGAGAVADRVVGRVDVRAAARAGLRSRRHWPRRRVAPCVAVRWCGWDSCRERRRHPSTRVSRMRVTHQSPGPSRRPRRSRGPIGVRAGLGMRPLTDARRAILVVEDTPDDTSSDDVTARARSRQGRSRPV